MKLAPQHRVLPAENHATVDIKYEQKQGHRDHFFARDDIARIKKRPSAASGERPNLIYRKLRRYIKPDAFNRSMNPALHDDGELR